MGAYPKIAHEAFDRLLSSREVAAFAVDTTLDPQVPGRRTAAEVQALLARADVILTTRLHGLVLSLAQGVPALAVDPISGGAKVAAQAQALDWPACLTVDALDDAAVERHFEWCLTPEANERVRASVEAGQESIKDIRMALARYLSPRFR